jgi:hypothetical protein
VACLAAPAPAAEPSAGVVVAQSNTDTDKDKDKKAKPKRRQRPTPPARPAPAPPPRTSETAAAEAVSPPPTATGETAAAFNAHMMGDFPARFALRTVTVPGLASLTVVGPPTTLPGPPPVTTVAGLVPVPAAVRVAIPTEGAFKVAENESPRPEDRVFLTYNFYDRLTGPPSAPALATFSGKLGRSTFFGSVFVPPTTLHTDVHREVLGFEKTFLGGSASVELRAPLIEQRGDGSLDDADVGDLTLILKYAFVNDHVSGDVLSAGLAVTAPTGRDVPTVAGNIHPVLLQPYLGYIVNQGPFYVEGFSSVVVPTDSRDVTLLFNDVSINYWLYRGPPHQTLRFVIPTLEAHVTTPLDHRSTLDPIFAPDLLVLTAGVHVGLGCASTLSLGVATPTLGQRAFDIEALAQFNWRF